MAKLYTISKEVQIQKSDIVNEIIDAYEKCSSIHIFDKKDSISISIDFDRALKKQKGPAPFRIASTYLTLPTGTFIRTERTRAEILAHVKHALKI